MKKFFKSKLGFTLVELMVALVILSIILAVGIPAYQNVTKNSRIKSCSIIRRSIASETKDWCYDFPYNPPKDEPYIYTVVIDENGKAQVGDANGNIHTDQGVVELLRDDVLGGDVEGCPADGVIKITVRHGANYPIIEVVCDGGTDGTDSHK